MMSGKSKSTKPAKMSSGLSKKRRINQRLKFLRRKVRRWDRYNEENHLSRHWNTDGLKRHIDRLEALV
jgi:hypothetical protein